MNWTFFKKKKEEIKHPFEKIWVHDHCKFDKKDFKLLNKTLDDDTYIEYNIWVKSNKDYLLEKYTPNVLSGHPAYSHIIFHAACLSCTSQKEHGIDRCRGCTSFKFDMDKPCLKIN